jgi:diacylglycerol kinase
MKKVAKSFSFAFNGIWFCVLHGVNFRIQLCCALVSLVVALYLKISSMEWMVILLCIAIVLCLEMINTAIEQLCDVVNPEKHAGIKLTKDIAAGAVLFSAILAAITGAFIFLPKILSIIQS